MEMKNIKLKNLLIGLTISIAIEILTYLLYPILYDIKQRHEVSYLEITPIIYLFSLILAISSLIYTFVTKQNVHTKLAITFVLFTLTHSNYLFWTIQCSCGEA